MNKEVSRRRVTYKHANFASVAASGKIKTTTRHMAALDFLSSISMIHEVEIKQSEMLKSPDELNEVHDIDTTSGIPNSIENKPPDGPGRMLPGRIAPTLAVIPEYRYKMKMYEQRNEVKRWEDQALAGGTNSTVVPILSSRLFFSRSRAYPLAVFSVIEYDAGEEKARLANIRAGDTHGFEVFKAPKRDWRGSSYEHKLSMSAAELLADHEVNLLDDSELRYGREHRHITRGSAQTGPVISSIILYANEHDLRESVNEQFLDRYPHLPPSLNISAIRDLTVSLAKCCLSLRIELTTGALAYISFERLCLQGIITKSNRNLCMAVSLLLAVKFTECFLLENQSVLLPALFEYMDREWDVSKKEVLEAEFGAYNLLNFTLLVPQHFIMVVYNRLLKLLRLTSDRYLSGYSSNY